MGKFDNELNNILGQFLVEGIEQSIKTVKVNIAGSDPVDIKVREILTDGGSIYISEEDVEGNITRGQDVTELIIPEEDFEETKLKGIGLSDEDLAAVSVANKLATQASGGAFGFNTPQKQMNAAYGKLMNKIAKKIDKIASTVK